MFNKKVDKYSNCYSTALDSLELDGVVSDVRNIY